MKCRGCGYIATNTVTGLCSECDLTIILTERELESRGISKYATLKTMKKNLHLGLVSQDNYDFYHDVWLTKSVRFSATESQVRAAFKRLEESTARRE